MARRRPTPRIPLLRLPQHGAASLVALVVILLGPPAATTTGRPPQRCRPTDAWRPRHRSRHTRAHDPGRRPGTGGRTARPGAPPGAAPVHAPTIVVQRHDTLWGLAERHLGSGSRFHQIVELNRGRPQPDGRTLTDPHWIYPGWVLRLPADAVGPGLRHPVRSAGDASAPGAGAGVAPPGGCRRRPRPGDAARAQRARPRDYGRGPRSGERRRPTEDAACWPRPSHRTTSRSSPLR